MVLFRMVTSGFASPRPAGNCNSVLELWEITFQVLRLSTRLPSLPLKVSSSRRELIFEPMHYLSDVTVR